jgi:AraC-like DNA-binding protein
MRSVDVTPLTDPFELEIQSWFLDPINVTWNRASARRVERTAARIAADGLDAVGVQLTLGGRATGDADGRAISTRPGDVAVLDSSRPFRVDDEGPREGLSLLIPRATFRRVAARPDQLHGRVFGPERSGLLAAFLRALPAALPTLPEAEGGVMARVILDLIAVMLGRPAPGAAEPGAWADAGRASQALAERATLWIDGNLGERAMTPSHVAEALSVSRSALYRAFEASGGVAAHIVKRRLAKVHQRLLNPNEARTTSELIYAAGFRSTTHFARIFRAAYGVTPKELREMVSPHARPDARVGRRSGTSG